MRRRDGATCAAAGSVALHFVLDAPPLHSRFGPGLECVCLFNPGTRRSIFCKLGSEAKLPRRPLNFAGQAATASLEIGPRSSEPCGRLALARTLVPACASNSARAHALARRVSAQDRRLHCSAAIAQLAAWRSGDACACTGSRSIPAGSLSVVGWCSPVGRPLLYRGPLADNI